MDKILPILQRPRFPVSTKLGCFVLTEIAMDECLFPKTHREEHGGKDRAKTGQRRPNMAAQCLKKIG